MKNICKSLSAVRKYFGHGKYSLLAPIANNPDFRHTCIDAGFNEWREAGITRILDVYTDDVLKSFQQLQYEFNISQVHFFRYLQMRSYLSSIEYYKQGGKTNVLDSILLKAAALKSKTITYIYDQVTANNKGSINIKQSWELDFGVILEDQIWSKVLDHARQITKSNKSYEVQYKIINKLHVTPLTRSKYVTCTKFCLKCKRETGTYFHLIWTCPLIASFWSSVVQEIERSFGIKVPLDPRLCILGVNNCVPETKTTSIMLYAARLSILHVWIEQHPPTVTLWREKLLALLPYERRHNVLDGTLDTFVNDWFPLKDYFGCDWQAITCINMD